jgi:membrane dipeptidase
MHTIIDAHQDLAYNFVNYQRDFRTPLAHTRERERGTTIPAENGTASNALDAALRGGVGLIFATVFVCPEWGGFGKVYRTPQEAHDQALEQLAYYETLASHPQLQIIRTRADLQRVQATWQRPPAERTIGLVILMEGADPIRTPDEFAFWYEQGVRALGLTWSDTRYAGGTLIKGHGGGPVTDDGFALMAEMARYNALLDLSHLSERAFYQTLEAYGGWMIASHSNPRRFRSSDRHLSDDMIQRLAAAGGVIGLVPYTRFLTDDPELAAHKANLRVERYAEAIDTVCQLTGSAQHAAIGSDVDGGFGTEHLPAEIDSVADFPRIPEALSQMGYTDADIALICHGNWLRMLELTLG